jgi:hypothetical protein
MFSTGEPQEGAERRWAITRKLRSSGLSHCMLGNPIEGERDSGLKLNTIPL